MNIINYMTKNDIFILYYDYLKEKERHQGYHETEIK